MCDSYQGIFQRKKDEAKVSTLGKDSLEKRAEKLKRYDILSRLVGQGHDLVANDICYYVPCMNLFKVTRIPKPSGATKWVTVYDHAFAILVKELDRSLFMEKRGYLLKTLKFRYCEILELSYASVKEYYKTSRLR